ncbi:MAG: proteasome accessory factor [Solirubrobacteraceae bacterium]|nr:proteasome accessory factor [Solirubrobacteraceae bacterium]
MAKDTEKLIRQLSLISYLMAERRPVTALEIRRDVEGYSGMNEDAFARRFYADRSELDSLGIQLTVDRPPDAVAEQENYSLRPEQFHLPAIAFTDAELAALGTALSLLDGEFAYAEPLRLALQQLTWGRPSPLHAPEQQPIALGIRAEAGGHELSQRLAKVETAIFRGKTILFDYYTMERDETGSRKVDPYHLLFQGGQFYVLGRAHDRGALRVFRLSRMRGKVAYATKAEHDFRRPTREEFDPREYASRAEWQFGETQGTAEVRVSERIAWQVSRHFGRFGEVQAADDGSVVFVTPYANARMLVSWVLRLGEHVRVLGPPELEQEVAERVEQLAARHADGGLELAGPADPRDAPAEAEPETPSRRGQGDSAIRPERFARLVTLASVLIDAGRREVLLNAVELCERLQISDRELREDIDVLNVVSFGGGTYVLYAEVTEDGQVEVDPEPYADNFARPARLLPVEAKALVAAIDLLGEHLPENALTSAREKIVAALGEDPTEHGLQVATTAGDDSKIARVVSEAIAAGRTLRLDYYKPNEDEFVQRTVEPYALMNGREGWYVASFDPARDDVRHFRLDRIRNAEMTDEHFTRRPEVDPAADVDGWPRTGEVTASRIARVWVSPERARWAREERRVHQELADGSVIVELPFKGVDWLVREVMAEAGDAVVLEPADAREAVLAAVGRLRAAAATR